MDQIQKWCEIRHNYILANESKLAYRIHIERYVPIYIPFDSLISWTQEDKGQELPPGILDGSKGCSWSGQVRASFLHRQALKAGTWQRDHRSLPRLFLLLCRSCRVRCDLLWVTDLCNPCGTISTVLHLSSMLALGKTLIQGETQRVQLASNFSALQSSTLSYVLNFCRKSIISQLERFFGLTSNWFSSWRCFGDRKSVV